MCRRRTEKILFKMSRIGNHRLRPELSNATRAKASIKTLEAKLKDAQRIGNAALVEKIRGEIAYLTINSLVPPGT